MLERSLLANRHYEQAAEAEDVRRAWDVLREASGWWSGREVSDPGGWEPHLEGRLAEAIREAAAMASGSPIPGAFAVRWDFLGLKERARRAALAPNAEADWAAEIAAEGGFLLHERSPSEYRDALARVSDEIAKDRTPQTVDRVLDAEMFRVLFRRLEDRPVPFARSYFGRRADLLNLGVALRGRLRGAERQAVQPWLVEGGALPRPVFLEAAAGPLDGLGALFAGTALGALVERLLSEGKAEDAGRRFERLADDHLTDFLRVAKYVSFGPEPLVGYLHGVEIEVKNVRRVFAGLAHGERAESIRADVRRAYV